jgi:hypothetical protein
MIRNQMYIYLHTYIHVLLNKTYEGFRYLQTIIKLDLTHVPKRLGSTLSRSAARCLIKIIIILSVIMLGSKNNNTLQYSIILIK